MSSWVAPTVAEFKANFVRDFPYAPVNDANNLKYIIDADIQSAINAAQVNFNNCLFGTNTTPIFMYLAAHTLVMAIRNSSMGLNSQAKFPLEASSVGAVSITNNINERFASDPIFAGLLKTGYGQMYLDLVYPYTVGNVDMSCGRTTFA
jgi:hypothetical protein